MSHVTEADPLRAPDPAPARAAYVECELDTDAAVGPDVLCAEVRRAGGGAVFLDGRGDADGGGRGPLVAVVSRPLATYRRAAATGTDDPLARLEAAVRARRHRGGSAHTGVVAVLGYDLLASEIDPARDRDGLPDMALFAVDAAVRFPAEARPVLAGHAEDPHDGERLRERVEALARAAGRGASVARAPGALVGSRAQPPRTSLPREQYLVAVREVQRHIRRGDVYQANLTQAFHIEHTGDPFALYRAIVAGTPAPRSAFVESADWSLVSASPESFLRMTPGGAIETRPIKGTRPRGATPDEDRRYAEELLASSKDRAELTMIVDLERNDLGRVCVPGSIHVSELAALRSYPAVHHLVARVRGELRPDIGPAELLRATFPGGSITGAPKIRAMQILARLEPVRRGFFTGCLFWFGDDGSLDSSILIRSIVTRGGRARLGAGGGIVAESDPEAEWHESNHKARALARALGFEPEEAR